MLVLGDVGGDPIDDVALAGGGLSYTQTFGYDQLNRLTTSQEGASWSQTNSYDRYGNRSIVGGGLTFNAYNNRITSAGFAYDAAGNLTDDTLHTYAFDAENRIKTVDGVANAYIYDGEGKRVRKYSPLGDQVRFVYGVSGQLVAEYDATTGVLEKEYVYGASGLLATIEPTAVSSNGTRYTTSDHLGSPRVVTNSAAGVVSRHDYMPFGEELGSGVGGRTTVMGFSVSDGQRQKFTSKERDIETGLDYSKARYYSYTQGRFSSPDPILSSGKPSIPQSWNYYTYCLNNPLLFVDLDGLIWGSSTKDGVTTYQWFRDLDELQYYGATVVTNFVIDMGNGTWATLNPNAAEHSTSSSQWEARQQYWAYTGLDHSWQDYLPVWGSFRRFMFDYATGDYEGALVNFEMTSAEAGTLNIGSSTAATKAFATESGEAIFYSGRTAATVAKDIAVTEGGKTIEMTTGGKILNAITKPMPQSFRDPFWNWGAKRFAREASGNVRAVLRRPLRLHSTWEKVEYPILRVNPFVRVIQR